MARSTGPTTPETDKIIVETDEVSLRGQDLVVDTDDLGYFRINTTGKGKAPLFGERFLSIKEAQKAIQGYVDANKWRLDMYKKARANGKIRNDETLP